MDFRARRSRPAVPCRRPWRVARPVRISSSAALVRSSDLFDEARRPRRLRTARPAARNARSPARRPDAAGFSTSGRGFPIRGSTGDASTGADGLGPPGGNRARYACRSAPAACVWALRDLFHRRSPSLVHQRFAIFCSRSPGLRLQRGRHSAAIELAGFGGRGPGAAAVRVPLSTGRRGSPALIRWPAELRLPQIARLRGERRCRRPAASGPARSLTAGTAGFRSPSGWRPGLTASRYADCRRPDPVCCRCG